MKGRAQTGDRGQLRGWLEYLKTSYWLAPLMMGLGALGLSLYMSEFAPVAAGSRGVEGAREILATIASSVVAVMGVVFSVLVVVLSLASSQYGSRVLRNYQRDRVQHFTIGMFIATFMYSILLLRTLRAGAAPSDYALLVAVALAVVSIATFVYFVHHVARSIQAPFIAAAISREWVRGAPHVQAEASPAASASPATQAATCLRSEGPRIPIRIDHSGYLQAIDTRHLVSMAVKAGAVFEVKARPGDFVLAGEVVALAHGERLRGISEKRCARAFVLGKQRTQAQDSRFAVVQLVEIALHALSPSINEPYTAVTCLHRLGEILSYAARENPPSRWRFDKTGALRVILPTTSFSELAAEAFEQIINFATNQPYVLRSALDIIGRIPVTSDDIRTGLAAQTSAITRATEECRDAAARKALIDWAALLSARFAPRHD